MLLDPCRNAWSKSRYAFLHGPKNLRFPHRLLHLNVYISRCEVVIHAGRERLRIGFVTQILLDPCRNAWSKNRYAILHGPKNLRFPHRLLHLNVYIRRCEVVIHAGRERLRIGFVTQILLDPCRNAWSKNRYAFLHGPKSLRFLNSLFLLNICIHRYEVVSHSGRVNLRIRFVT